MKHFYELEDGSLVASELSLSVLAQFEVTEEYYNMKKEALMAELNKEVEE